MEESAEQAKKRLEKAREDDKEEIKFMEKLKETGADVEKKASKPNKDAGKAKKIADAKAALEKQKERQALKDDKK